MARKRGTVFLGVMACALIAAAPASAAKPKLSVTDATVAEGAGTAAVTVSLSKRAKRKVKVSFATGDGSARAGSDYADTAGTLKLRARKRSASIAIPVTADDVDEPDETLAVTLGGPKRARIADGEATVTITDDDAPVPPPAEPIVSVTTASVAEGTGSNPPHVIEVELSAPSAAVVEVGYATASGTATSGVDFDAATGNLTFDPGQTSRTFDLTTIGDFEDEVDETVAINLSPAGAQPPGSQQAVTIADDDAPCVTPDSPPGINLGTVNGDTNSGSHELTHSSDISPCLDTDWFAFRLAEISDSTIDLHARLTLSTAANSSPSGGDIDLCVQLSGSPGTETCSTEGPGVTEVITVCVDDEPLGGADDSSDFLVEVDGFGNAVNDYDLSITGNVAFTTPDLNLGGC
jgi:hypothetical protein